MKVYTLTITWHAPDDTDEETLDTLTDAIETLAGTLSDCARNMAPEGVTVETKD
jgi:hypothetical protein